MIEKMEKISIYGLSDDAPRLMRDILHCGCLQISDPRQLEEFAEVTGVVEKRDSQLYDWQEKQSCISATLAILQPHIKSGGLFAPRPKASARQLYDDSWINETMELCDRVDQLQKELAELHAQQGRVAFQKDSLLPWKDYMVPLEETGTKSCRFQLLTLPLSVDEPALELELDESGLAAKLYEASSDKDQHYIVMMAHKSAFAAAEELLRQKGASRLSFSEVSGTAAEALGRCERKQKELTDRQTEIEAEIKLLAEQGDRLKAAYDGIQLRIDCLTAQQKLVHTSKACLVTAWLPVNRREEVEKLLSGYICYYELTTPEPGEETPVLLKNNRWIAPFESVTQMYSLPSSNGIDPDPFMAPFFFIFFGMMFSDAGYGLMLTIGGLVGAKLLGGNKLLKMLGYCGISTIIWGLLYGSFFGDTIQQVARTFFGVTIPSWGLIDPLEDPITILVISLALGALHIFVGMALKAYLMVKRGHPWAALFDVGSWYLVLIGLVMLVAGGTVGKIGQYMAIIGAVTLILTQGREKKNIFGKLASGVLSLYDITGYFSDVLSYSRIMALGLATGVIASVVNTMGTMPGGSFVGFLVFIAAFVFGHLLNFAINALGSYVHTSRLQYVEFFGKFFEGGGEAFTPLRANTKYVNINNQEDK